jgi:hypothetical protein
MALVPELLFEDPIHRIAPIPEGTWPARFRSPAPARPVRCTPHPPSSLLTKKPLRNLRIRRQSSGANANHCQSTLNGHNSKINTVVPDAAGRSVIVSCSGSGATPRRSRCDKPTPASTAFPRKHRSTCGRRTRWSAPSRQPACGSPPPSGSRSSRTRRR